MAIYETVVILDSLMAPKEIDDSVERFSTLIKDNGGNIREVDKWGKRRLAYEIEKKQYGFYVAIEFEAPEAKNIPSVLQAEFNYSDSVLRFLTYKYDKHKLAAMAKEAKKVRPSSEEPEAEKPKAKAAPAAAEKPAEAPKKAAAEEVKETKEEEKETTPETKTSEEEEK